MRYSNVDFSVVYVDPSKSSSGDGTTPAKALNALPSTTDGFADATAYVIRRTAETSAATLPNGTNSSVKNILLVGMPNASDELYALMPDEAKSAWGTDSAEYANIQFESNSGSFQLPSVNHFLLHRVYLFRDGINADSYILKFYNSSDFTGCYSFEHCKFGSRGVDLDKSTYTGTLTTSRCKSYVYVYYARILNIADCVINHALTGNSTNGHGIYCYQADILNVRDVRVHSAAWTDYSQVYPLQLCATSAKGVECNISGVSQTIRMNGATATHLPTLMDVQGFVSCVATDISVSMGADLGTTAPSTLQNDYPLVRFYQTYELSLTDVDIDLPNFWNCKSPLLRIERCYSGNYVPGVVKKVDNVSVKCASEDGIGSPLTYSYATQTGDSYAAVAISFSSSDATLYAKVPQISNLSVSCPRGKAAYIENARLTDAEFEGTVVLKQTVADIKSISTWFPGKALYVSDASHARVRKMTVNLENPTYPYAEEPAVYSTFDNNANVFIDASNASVSSASASSSTATHVYQGVGCNNEGEEGHFVFRCANGTCDTWSVHRTGGGSAALKLSNTTCSSPGTMVLGRRPFNGMQLLPTTTGRHTLRAHVALKGYAKDSELYRQFIVSAECAGKTYYSTVHGRWADDSSSVWVNDSELTQLVLEMPFDIPEVSPVDVRVYFSWYSSGGFVYLDPAIELVQS